MKTCRISNTFGTNLIDFIFDLTLIPIQNPSSLYDIIRFVSSSLRQVENFTILCRFSDGISFDEETFRSLLSFTYSVKKLQLFIEMNNSTFIPFHQFNFNEKAYTYPFWIEKNLHANIYRNENDHIKRVRIYTLPLSTKIVNSPNHFDDTYQTIP